MIGSVIVLSVVLCVVVSDSQRDDYSAANYNHGDFASMPHYPYNAKTKSYQNKQQATSTQSSDLTEDLFSADWDREHNSRRTYDVGTLAWIRVNLKVAWEYAVKVVSQQNSKYSKSKECGFTGNPNNSTETRLQKQAEILTVAAQWLWDNYPRRNKDTLHNAMLNVDPTDFKILSDCLSENYNNWVGTCNQYQKYSRPDQICNNKDYPNWGALNDIGVRITDIWNYDGGIWLKQKTHIWPNYDGTYSDLMGEKQLADLLDKSNNVCYNVEVTMLHAYFAQFITNDIIKSAPYTVTNPSGEQVKPQCCNIDKDCRHHACHPVTSRGRADSHNRYESYCMQYSDNVPGIDYCRPQAKDNRNQETAYIDGSAIYGTTCERAAQLRSYQNGKLKVNKGYYGLHSKNINLPDDPQPDRDECDVAFRRGNLNCVMSGDKRVNQHPGLTAFHTIWLRFHNRVAVSCSKALDNHYYTEEELDEICYQETRRFVQAILQNIFYRDVLPIQIGANIVSRSEYGVNVDKVVPYNPNIHASVWPEFTYAAGRMHSTVSHWSQVRDPARASINWQEPQSWFSISDFLYKGYDLIYSKGNLKELIQNSLYDPQQCFDTSFVAELRAGLGASAYNPSGLDLLTINLARSREFGIPWYTQLREFCGMSPVYEWYHLKGIFSQHCLDTLPEIYGNVKNVEGYVGLICEVPLAGALVGPTSACILQRQYQTLRESDRFFFDRNGFTDDQLKVVKKIDLAKILCITADMDYISENVFRIPNEKTNQYVACKNYTDITEADLASLWTTAPIQGHVQKTCRDFSAAYGASDGASMYLPKGRSDDDEDLV